MTPAVNIPSASQAVMPAQVRANPMAAATSTPMGAQPPQQPNVQPPSVSGATQPGLPMNQQAKAAALKRAELYSIFYKFGAQLKKPSQGQHIATGAAIGGGLGGAAGVAAGLMRPTPPVPEVPVSAPSPNASIDEILSTIKNTDSAKTMRDVIRSAGTRQVLKRLGLVGAGLGILGGAGAGMAYHAYKNRKNRV